MISEVNEVKRFFQKALTIPSIRKKILITAGALVIFRLVAHIPAAGIDRDSLARVFSQSPVLSLLDIFSGGTLASFSIMALGLGPYINASIIIQLFTFLFPSLKELSKEGEWGQEKINQYTRLLTIPLTVVQSFLMYSLLLRLGVVTTLSPIAIIALVATMTAGTALAIWLGELITQYGITNGISLLIFVGIISRLPISIVKYFAAFNQEDLLKAAIFVGVAIFIIAAVIFVNEAVRKLPIHSSRRGIAKTPNSSFLPLKLNHAGVIPIFFALSLTITPNLLSGFLAGVDNPTTRQIASDITRLFSTTSPFYNILYFSLVVGFTYFYTSITFNTADVAENLQKSGSFIPGVRPGKETARHISEVLSRITLPGALFLGSIAILPSLLQGIVGIDNLVIGGTGVLIVVSVILEATREIESQMVMRGYDKFLN